MSVWHQCYGTHEAKDKFSNIDPVFIEKFKYFVYHGCSYTKFVFKKYCIEIFFLTFITEYFGAPFNFGPQPRASLASVLLQPCLTWSSKLLIRWYSCSGIMMIIQLWILIQEGHYRTVCSQNIYRTLFDVG